MTCDNDMKFRFQYPFQSVIGRQTGSFDSILSAVASALEGRAS